MPWKENNGERRKLQFVLENDAEGNRPAEQYEYGWRSVFEMKY